MSYENVLVERDGDVAVITVNRPKALNALNSATLRELTQAVRECATGSRENVQAGGLGKKAW